MAEIQAPEANLRTYLQVLGRRIHWLLAITVLVVALALAYSFAQPKKYSATAQLLVQPSGSVPIGGTQQTVSPTDVLTDLQLITGAPVKAKVEKKLGFSPSISATQVGQTNVISLTVTASSPGLAAESANVYAKVFTDYQTANALNALTTAESQLQSQIDAISQQLVALRISAANSAQVSALTTQQATLQSQLAQLRLAGSETPGGIEIASKAIPPSSPSSPRPIKDGLIALVIGLLLGAAAAFLVEYFDNKVYTKNEAERLSGGVPVLALIPRIVEWRKAHQPFLISDADPFSHATESYRSLRTSLRFAGHEKKLKTILITSSSGAEGKTSTVANLGIVLARAGERVVVVGCDLRRPRLGNFLGQTETLGFTSVLLGVDSAEDLRKALQPVPKCPGLAFLPAGPTPPNPTELLGSNKAAEIFRLLASRFDTILIDSPPLLPVADAQVLSEYSDAVLMVVMAGKTTRGKLERAVELLSHVHVRPAGIILNRVTRRSHDAANYGYSGYGYKYQKTSSHAETNGNGNGNGNGNEPVLPALQLGRGVRT